ncbi:MAG TPA: response regulator transcription factor [Acidimicrobiales bacterium]|nr:response regulator transcription factor [Acidimicrobiales bacterium]
MRDNEADVLLVEDHELVRHALTVALELAGLRTTTATDLSVEGVLELARRTRPDVVVLDYFLDDEVESLPMVEPLTGLGAAVLVLTGAADPHVWGACLLAGAVGVLDKSGRLDALVERVQAVQRGEPAMAEGDRERLLAAARLAQAGTGRGLGAGGRAGTAGGGEGGAGGIGAGGWMPFDRLTPKEAIVLRQLAAGRTPEDIARDEYVSITTVRLHVDALLAKLGVSSRLAAVTLAREVGWA